MSTRLTNSQVKKYLPWINKVIYPFLSFGICKDDLVQESLLVLTQQSSKCDLNNIPKTKAYLSSFIRRALTDYTFENQRIVSFGRSRKIQHAIYAIRSSMIDSYLSTEIKNKLIEELSMTGSEIEQWATYITGSDVDSDEISPSDLPSTPDLIDMMSWSPYEAQLEACQNSISTLSESEQQIIKYRYLDENTLTLKDISKSLDLGVTRVWQIEKKALKELYNLNQDLMCA